MSSGVQKEERNNNGGGVGVGGVGEDEAGPACKSGKLPTLN